nr:hypothetical protein [Tanacetum cinerariifolium]
FIHLFHFIDKNITHTHSHRRPPAGHRQPPSPPKNFSGELFRQTQKHSSHPDLLDPPHHSPPRAVTTPKVTTSAAPSTHRRHPLRPHPQPAPPPQNHHHYLVSRRTTTTSSSPPPSSPRHNHTNATTTATAPSRVRLVLKHHQGVFGICTSRVHLVGFLAPKGAFG